jgi:hypothetical protein
MPTINSVSQTPVIGASQHIQPVRHLFFLSLVWSDFVAITNNQLPHPLLDSIDYIVGKIRQTTLIYAIQIQAEVQISNAYQISFCLDTTLAKEGLGGRDSGASKTIAG